MKNIIMTSSILAMLSTAAYACPGHHHPCSPTECAPAKESSTSDSAGKKVAQVNLSKSKQNGEQAAGKTVSAPVKD